MGGGCEADTNDTPARSLDVSVASNVRHKFRQLQGVNVNHRTSSSRPRSFDTPINFFIDPSQIQCASNISSQPLFQSQHSLYRDNGEVRQGRRS